MNGPAWRRYLRFWGPDSDADLDDELRFHLESRIQEYIAAGMSPEQARAEAVARFGNVERVRETCHAIDHSSQQERRRADLSDNLRQDLRHAFRALRRDPGFTLVAVLTLGLGIGATTAIFSVVNGVLLRPLPYRDSGRLVRLFTAFRGSGDLRYAMSQPEFLDYKGLSHVFENAAAFTGTTLTLTGTGEPERVRGIAATRDLFPVLGVTPLLGRGFEGDEGRTGVEPVVILSHGFWQGRLGGVSQILGRALILNGISRRVVGILPPGVTLNQADAFIPLFINPDSMTSRGSNYLQGAARLRLSVSIEQAQRELNALTRRLEVEHANAYPANMGYSATVIGMREEMVGQVQTALLILLGAVGLVLLIACANVANLLLARGEARQREMALRLALGAGRGRIIRQLLTESSVLALTGAAGGVLLAWWGMKALLAINPEAIPRLQEVRIDATVGLVTLLVSLLTGILFGLAPALQQAGTELQSALQAGARGGSESGHRLRLGRSLVAGEIALAVVVVIGAALLLRSFWTLRHIDPGFRSDQLLVVDLSIPVNRYNPQASTEFYRQLVERMATLPGVELAAAASDLPPVAGGYNWDIAIEGRPRAPGEASPSPNIRAVTREYFRALSIPAMRGRFFGNQDGPGSMPVAVLNQTAARAIWPGADPVGQRVRFGAELPWITIIGIAGDARSAGLDAPVPAEMYLLHQQLPVAAGGSERSMYVVLQTAGDPVALATSARRIVQEQDPLLAITGIRSMTEIIHRSLARPRFTMLLLGIFGAVALSLAAVGIYGIMSYAVRRRTREMGIRMALGAPPRDVVRLVVRQGMRLTLLGLAIGLVAALLATRAMSRLLYGVSATDPLSFAAIALLLAVVAFLASWVPARRGARTDPMSTLRTE